MKIKQCRSAVLHTFGKQCLTKRFRRKSSYVRINLFLEKLTLMFWQAQIRDNQAICLDMFSHVIGGFGQANKPNAGQIW